MRRKYDFTLFIHLFMYLFKFMFTSLIHQVSEKQDYFVEKKKTQLFWSDFNWTKLYIPIFEIPKIFLSNLCSFFSFLSKTNKLKSKS